MGEFFLNKKSLLFFITPQISDKQRNCISSTPPQEHQKNTQNKVFFYSKTA